MSYEIILFLTVTSILSNKFNFLQFNLKAETNKRAMILRFRNERLLFKKYKHFVDSCLKSNVSPV